VALARVVAASRRGQAAVELLDGLAVGERLRIGAAHLLHHGRQVIQHHTSIVHLYVPERKPDRMFHSLFCASVCLQTF